MIPPSLWNQYTTRQIESQVPSPLFSEDARAWCPWYTGGKQIHGGVGMKNGVMFQGFEWHCPEDGSYYREMAERVEELGGSGITAFWLPPAAKGTGVGDVGYGVYDLYDLGEFDQKGTVRTKYGTKAELLELVRRLHGAGIQVYADVVLNHMGGADGTETFLAVKVDSGDRNREIEGHREIEGWTRFDFPGRGGAHSAFRWSHVHFNGVDYDARTGEKAIFRILGEHKGWNWGVSQEHGNYDYLMFADLDHAHPDVQKELFEWSDWFVRETGVDGFRLDAVKHIDHAFMKDFQGHLRARHGQGFYLVGEYWHNDITVKEEYLAGTEFGIDLFDVGLHYHLHQASVKGADYDLRRIFDDTLVKEHPGMAVTFVDNHDSQPGQSLQSWVEPWFKESAYALVLLRKEGYPCVFYGDYYGIGGEQPQDGMKEQVERLLKLRRRYCHGEQEDYFDSPHRIGWVRRGEEGHPHKLAVVVSNREEGPLPMFVGVEEAGKTYVDRLGNHGGRVSIGSEGFGEFPASPGSVSVWMEEGLD
ncbi:alpha-amylase [Clostridiales bacterium F-3ap]|uniref:Alpha-amylase n=2 Tax=Anaerotalea alkaliphila TaxID=2662126 RepID=A0A7X5KNA6_9FIRM|nr:alpha-amylase [Anaerotalea alkaliphila]NDL66587.1 alpha-amylase [Anaerotalea alkaliphila]